MSAPLFKVGDRVVVWWMGKRAEATVAAVITRGYQNRVLKQPHYQLVGLPGAPGPAYYQETEIEATAVSRHTQPGTPQGLEARSGTERPRRAGGDTDA